MYRIYHHADHMFVKITQRHQFMRNLAYGSCYSTSWKTHSSLHDPVEVSDENVISWTSKISSLVRRNKPEEAIGLFKTMLVSEQKPNYVTVLSVIRALGALNLEILMKMIHRFVITMGFEAEMSVVTALLNFYSAWNMEIVLELFDQIQNKDVVLWSAMVSACVKSGKYVEAFGFLREMQFGGVKPNHVSIVSILPACADLGDLWFGKEVHGFSVKTVFYSHTNIQNSLVHMYAKCRDLEASVRVFDGIPEKDIISWRTMIRGCMENECPGKALNMFSEMQACCFEPDENIIQEVVAASLQAEELNFGVGLHCLMLKNGYLAFVSIVTVLLHMYAKFGKVECAINLFNQLRQKDLIAYSAMISAYAQSEEPSNAFEIFKDMQLANEKPNEVTFVSLLQASSIMAAEEICESIHAHVTKAGYSSNTFLTSALIDLYCKFGRIKQGKALFDETPTNDLICWSSMINGYGINGYGHEALETFSKMLNSGIEPNDVVFISVLSACSHCGLEHEGWNWFYVMEEKFCITPKLAHYACMVDLLSRRGNVEAALEFVNKMPIEPDIRIWGALLAGCRKTSESTVVAEIAAHRLIDLDPENISYHVFLSNLYAEQGRWEDVERLRNFLEEKGLKKEVGYSMVEASL